MPDGIAAVPFIVLAAAALGGAVMVVASRNVVHSAFWLLEVMVAIAGLFMLLSAGFLSLVQIMVYAGAVSVLTLFTVMLTLRRREDAVRPRDHSWSAAGVATAVLVLVLAALSTFKPAIASSPSVTPGVFEFGTALFSEWALPFEIASVVLLIALVAAVWWSGGDER